MELFQGYTCMGCAVVDDQINMEDDTSDYTICIPAECLAQP